LAAIKAAKAACAAATRAAFTTDPARAPEEEGKNNEHHDNHRQVWSRQGPARDEKTINSVAAYVDFHRLLMPIGMRGEFDINLLWTPTGAADDDGDGRAHHSPGARHDNFGHPLDTHADVRVRYWALKWARERMEATVISSLAFAQSDRMHPWKVDKAIKEAG
jgi:hypothetical protein